ncbi:hypothetical protein [uncultured Methylobacterium sp.]|uniref:hypothetical protein n=1 Tax=uncultured Methylobacterium sp. TaxID=157278 RepID=UPI0035C9F40F
MTDLTIPATQVCAFALGCALIHAARAYATTVARVLTGLAILAAVLVLLGASLARAPDDDLATDGITIFNDALLASG